MKCIYLFLWFLCVQGNAQNIEILLIGASHNYSNNPPQDFSTIDLKIKKFKPHAFFGEFVSKEDERLLLDYWCKPQNIRRLERLRKNRPIDAELLSGKINSMKKLALVKTYDYHLKTDLAHAYYLNQDVANGHFQFWQVIDHLKRFPDKDLEKYLNDLLSPEMDTTGRSMKRLRTSEYSNIAFPAMLNLGIKELMPMDCQTYDLNWSAAAQAFHAKFDKYNNEITGVGKSEVAILLGKRNTGFQKYASMEKSSKNLTEWLNTDEAATILSSGDFYFPELYDLKGFPKEEMFAQLHWWEMRNEGMCDNVINMVRKMGFTRIVVVVGANHRKYMRDIFNRMPNVVVKNIND